MCVRYAATLDSGDILVAEDGGYILFDRTGPAYHEEMGGFPFVPSKVRRVAPHADDHFYLVRTHVAHNLVAFDKVTQATVLDDDLVLIGTHEPVRNALWGGKVVEQYANAEAYELVG